MLPEPTLALGVSARDWPDRLRQFLADHGGARVRLTALAAHDLEEEDHDALIIDDICSFVSRALVGRERELGRAVIGVFDPAEPAGRGYLTELGVDAAVSATEAAEAFLSAVTAHATPEARRGRHEYSASVEDVAGGSVVNVYGVSGGVGSSETALGLASVLSGAVVVELNRRPSAAQRLGLDLHPNVVTAVEIAEHGAGDVAGALQQIGSVRVLVGASEPLSEASVRRVVDALRHRSSWTIVDRGDARPSPTPDSSLIVTVASPVGIRRCLDGLRGADLSRTHLVVNRAPRGGYERAELMRCVLSEIRPRSVTIVPEDPGVTLAAWNGGVVTSMPFCKAMGSIGLAIGGAA